MPELVMMDNVRATTYGFITCSPVSGLTPLLASVAAITARSHANVALDDGVVAQQISNCAIAIASFALGSKHRLINAQFVSGKSTQRVEDAGKSFIASGFMQGRRAGNRAGIDHRVIGAVIGSQTYR